MAIDTKDMAFVAYDKDQRMVLATSLNHADGLRDFFRDVVKHDFDYELATADDVRKGFGDIKGQPRETKPKQEQMFE